MRYSWETCSEREFIWGYLRDWLLVIQQVWQEWWINWLLYWISFLITFWVLSRISVSNCSLSAEPLYLISTQCLSSWVLVSFPFVSFLVNGIPSFPHLSLLILLAVLNVLDVIKDIVLERGKVSVRCCLGELIELAKLNAAITLFYRPLIVIAASTGRCFWKCHQHITLHKLWDIHELVLHWED